MPKEDREGGNAEHGGDGFGFFDTDHGRQDAERGPEGEEKYAAAQVGADRVRDQRHVLQQLRRQGLALVDGVAQGFVNGQALAAVEVADKPDNADNAAKKYGRDNDFNTHWGLRFSAVQRDCWCSCP